MTNLERKKKEQIQGKTNRRRPIFHPFSICIPNLKLLSLMVVEI